ncbi:MAG: ATP-binding cassette domain-containing protein, partial [Clostridiales bacterium]|nr:ATP-binding cassette domain-containing protein [Clostridiales bacterium]
AEIERRVMAALKNVDMAKYKLRTPDTLSGGQQQRVAIARALVKNPRIMLADEPTGNLDEANTIMIMDLLKQISRDHLVLLVTHEANLVEFYCDRIIEIVDGRINSVRENRGSTGFSQRDKNGIYLGEFEKKTTVTDGIELEYFAREGQELPLNLKIINDNGKVYIKIGDPKVKIIDRTSELKLHEGVYSDHREAAKAEIDMSDLQPFKGKKFGRLFSWQSSVVSGYRANFSNKKNVSRLFKNAMILCALVAVIMAAVFGTSFRAYANVKDAYNHNIFFVYLENSDDFEKMREGLSQYGIDNYSLYLGWPQRASATMQFGLGNFETFRDFFLELDNVFLLDSTLAQDLVCVAGVKELRMRGEVLITTAAADKLIENAGVDYIRTYNDVVGLISRSYYYGEYRRIVGVVESKETNFYFRPVVLAEDVLSNSMLALINTAGPGNTYVKEVAPGKAVWIVRDEYEKNNKYNPKIGDTIGINGVNVEVMDIIRPFDSYSAWYAHDFGKEFTEFMAGKMKAAYPELAEGTEEYDAAYNANYFAFEQEYYALLPDYIGRMSFFYGYDWETQLFLWAAREKNIEVVKFTYYDNFTQSYFADLYKKQNGAYPVYNSSDFAEFIRAQGGEKEAFNERDQAINGLWDEFWRWYYYGNVPYYESAYIVSEDDYVAVSKSYGKTHITAAPNYYSYSGAQSPEYIDGIFYQGGYYRNHLFLMIHTTDVAATGQFLSGLFDGRSISLDYRVTNYSLVTPQDMFDLMKNEMQLSITGQIIAMAVVLGLLSLCMYFIMRSSFMARVKEVGIYRAIGVSRRNLLFKFLMETLVLTTLTIFIGFAIASVLLFAWLGGSPFMSQIFYYPVWLAGALLALLYLICLVCGLLPIALLLRKTPSAIMAKYDI